MEIHLDIATVNTIAAAEQAQASTELQQSGPFAALANSQRRHDARLAAAADAGTLACKAGCSWCCWFSVDVRPVEVFALLEFMARELDATEQQRIRRQIGANLQLLAGADGEQRARSNVQCPFLQQGRCGVYSVRPQTCRNYHATSAVGCQRCFEHPDDMEIDPEFAPLTYQTGAAHVDGFSMAMARAGYDNDAYEMNAALAQALADPTTALQRFEARQAPFPQLEGMDVPLALADPE